MVHQFRFPVKGYMSGSGRRARWLVQAPGAPIRPQFWINPDSLRPETAARVREARIGFCDVTGQTNERTVLAARIPADVVCGNKVPTIRLATTVAPHNEMTDVWLAVANSLTFDWLARRVVTTSLNFFLLRSLPFPAWERLRANWGAIAQIAAQLSASSDGAPPIARHVGVRRASSRDRGVGCGLLGTVRRRSHPDLGRFSAARPRSTLPSRGSTLDGHP